MLLRIYGKIIISWEAQIEFLSLVPDNIPTPLLICELLTIVIHGVFSSRVKLQHLSQFYIADSVTSMLFPMSIHVILHEVLLILLMVIHPMLPLLIDEVTTATRLMPHYLFGLHKSQNILLSFKYAAKNPKLIHNTPDFAEDFDSPICLDCTKAIICLACTTARSITIFKIV